MTMDNHFYLRTVSLKLVYTGDKLVRAVLNGRQELVAPEQGQ